MALPINIEEQPYLYNGKEFIEAHGLNEYDSQARYYYATIMRTTTMDPHAEDYYHISPYAWCGNNPMAFVDPECTTVIDIQGHMVKEVHDDSFDEEEKKHYQNQDWIRFVNDEGKVRINDGERPESKEVIGGYILFPGRGDDESISKRFYSKSIEQVNIGAFPLLPCGKEAIDTDPEGPQLFAHLKNILLVKNEVVSHVEKAIPQKGLYYTTEPSKTVEAKNILTGLVQVSDEYLPEYQQHKAKRYIIKEVPSKLLEAKYLLPMVGSGGMIDGIYHINSVKLDEIDGQTKVVLRLGEFIPFGEKQVKVYRVMRPNELLTLSQAQALYNEN